MADAAFEENERSAPAAQAVAEVPEVVECRQRAEMAGAAWFLLALGGFLCLGPWIDWMLHRKTDELAAMIGVSCIGVLFGGLGLWCRLAQRRGHVIADGQGLRWRGAGRWRSAYWGEVRDYYETQYSQNGSLIAIETEASKILLALTNWTHGDQLKAAVKARATRTRTRSWAKQGAREEDAWPRVFGYDAAKNRRAMWGMRALLAAVLFLPLLLWGSKSPEARFGPGWPWTLAGCGLLELMLVPFVIAFASTVREYRDALRRQGERITADAQGLTYDEDLRRVRVAWSEIRTWSVGNRERSLHLRNLYTIGTDTDTFEFTRYIEDGAILTEWITAHLGRKPEAPVTEDVCFDAVQGTAGRNVYTYRTRDNRALLLLPTFFALAAPASFLISLILPSGRPVTLGDMLFRSLAVVGLWSGMLFAWGRYIRARIETDAEGITERRLFRVHRVAWNDVRSYGMVRDVWLGHAEVVGTQDRVRFGPMLAHCDQLKAEIAQQATRSSNREWNALQRSSEM